MEAAVLLVNCARRRVSALVVLTILAGGIVAVSGMRAEARSSAAGGNAGFAGLVDIGGGRRLYLACKGTGSPTVVLEAGYRSPATVWTDDFVQPEMPRTMVFDGVADFTRVCLYERPGVTSVIDEELVPSRSDPVPQPRDVEGIVADLHALLQAADVPGPYVLVAHSFGGLLARLYAATYPEEIAGMVLVDAWNEAIQEISTPAQWAAILELNAAVPSELAGQADYETIDFGAGSAVMRQAALAQPLPPIPLAVLARSQPLGIGDDVPILPSDSFEEIWRVAQRRLSLLVPGAGFIVAEESSHYIQLEQPDLVIDAVGEVVEAVRRTE